MPFDDLGTMEHFDHLFLTSEGYWSGADPLVRRFARLEGSWGSTPVVARDLYTYFEAAQMGNIRFPGDVRFVIGTFPRLFGSLEGLQLQALAARHGWVLVWALGLNIGDVGVNFVNVEQILGNRTFALNERLIDPVVARQSTAGFGLPVGADVVAAIERRWREAATLRWRGRASPAAVERLWRNFAGELPADLHVSPLRAGACTAGEGAPECVGVTGTGRCVCYGAPPLGSGLVQDHL